MLLEILGEKIRDNRFLRLIKQMLRAGYLEDWKWNATLSGAPQGGVLSPLLSNIYMDRLDKFAETALIPEGCGSPEVTLGLSCWSHWGLRAIGHLELPVLGQRGRGM